MRILADASLPYLEQAFPKPFQLTRYQTLQDVPKLLQGKDILFCRSTLAVNERILANAKLLYVATASSGIDHIDTAYLTKRQITLLDAKGCNASAVADYVLSCLALLEQQGYLTSAHRRIGIIGIGAVGSIVSARLLALGFTVKAYDPLRAQHDAHFHSACLSELYGCDILCLHANLHRSSPFPSYHLIHEDFLKQLKPGTILINAARGGIVDEAALLSCSKLLVYCTDVYGHEPDIDPRILEKAIICTPHIAGHSIEAKNNAVWMISKKLHAILGLIPPRSNPLLQSTGEKEIGLIDTWQNWVLSLYNPLMETQALKQSFIDIPQTFLNLRKAHQFRHDFEQYESFYRFFK